MKKSTLLFASIFALCGLANAQYPQLKTPAPSTTQTVKQEFGISTVELSYSRPAIRGRAIFGDLVPYGKVWRTGANNATTITFGDDVMIGGKTVPAGKYGLLTIPDKDKWTFIISKQTDVTSPADYKMDQDVVRVTAEPATLPFSIENFSIMFNDVKPTSMNIDFVWDNLAVSLPVTVEIDSKIMAQIKTMEEANNLPYFSAAMYYINNGKDQNKALTWLDKAIVQEPKGFWIYHQKANLLAKLGKKQDAITAANKSIELAKEAKNDDYVALNEKLLKSIK
ncbi:MAG TPA: DUF2911 domain-containing protein [Chitinophagaceae bacterium]|nr:DUF2911 domain-containing protein [Chitinophagaceae bacterium]